MIRRGAQIGKTAQAAHTQQPDYGPVTLPLSNHQVVSGCAPRHFSGFRALPPARTGRDSLRPAGLLSSPPAAPQISREAPHMMEVLAGIDWSSLTELFFTLFLVVVIGVLAVYGCFRTIDWHHDRKLQRESRQQSFNDLSDAGPAAHVSKMRRTWEKNHVK